MDRLTEARLMPCVLHMEAENLILSLMFSINLKIPLGKKRLRKIADDNVSIA